jgi:hypothetical protein
VIRGTSTRVTVIMALIITVVLIDTLSFRIALFYREASVLTNMFIIVSIIISIGQLAILLLIRERTKAQVTGHHLGLMQRLVPIVQYTLVAIVVAVILQLVLITYYNTILLILAVAISYATSLVMMGLLAQKFVSWFKSNKRWIVLLYGISFAILFVDIVVTLSLTINLLLNAPTQIWPHYGIVDPQITRGSLTEMLTQAYVIFSIVSFAAMWFTTALLLYSYSLKLGRLRYWLFLCSPAFFLRYSFH